LTRLLSLSPSQQPLSKNSSSPSLNIPKVVFEINLQSSSSSPLCPLLSSLSSPLFPLPLTFAFRFQPTPNRNADFYHTVNNLAGLSSSQHRLILSPDRSAGLAQQWRSTPAESTTAPSVLSDEQKKDVFVQALGWKEVEKQFLSCGGEANRVVSSVQLLSRERVASNRKKLEN